MRSNNKIKKQHLIEVLKETRTEFGNGLIQVSENIQDIEIGPFRAVESALTTVQEGYSEPITQRELGVTLQLLNDRYGLRCEMNSRDTRYIHYDDQGRAVISMEKSKWPFYATTASLETLLRSSTVSFHPRDEFPTTFSPL